MIRDSYFVHKKSHEPRLSSKRFREIGEKRKTECFARLKKWGPIFRASETPKIPFLAHQLHRNAYYAG